ncbi:Uma2 family endonuclease [Anatilimnocola floriformis]|uniref:Uma2 family endonuclease n=1 Tax=Anatilimnocola floriformis TaxID=2948575 RepID=UPI0020C42566|nr:Uma2 family endonuclease [Anatilimnocola floriformis]
MSTVNPPRGPIPFAVPPLENGDRLTRDEFERRYRAMPNLKKAELIEGVVYMPATVRYSNHGRPHSYLTHWIGDYVEETPGVDCGNDTSARLDLDNMPQPDAMLLILPECGGNCQISEDDYIENAPELVAEVSSSTVSFDLNTKKDVYRRCGVREYIVWRVLDREIDWFILENNQFVPLKTDAQGIYKSHVFPGLWLDAAALVAGSLKKVTQALKNGIDSHEHTAFVKKLNYQAQE